MSSVKSGTTSRTEYFNLVEKTAGTAKTGVTINQLLIGYTRTRQGNVTTNCSALSNTSVAWSSGGAIEVDGTGAPGLYRVDVPDAAYSTAAGVDTVILTLYANTTTLSVAPAMKEVQLDITVSSVTGNVGGAVGSVTGNVGGSVGSVVGNVGGAVGSVTGNVGGSVASVSGNVGGSVGSVVGNVGGSVNSVATSVLANSVTGNVGGSVGSVVGNVGGSVASVIGNVGGSVGSVLASVLASSVTGNVGGSVGSVVGNVGGTTGDFVSTISESYRANGAAGTPAQILYELLGHHTEKTVSGVTMTIKKLDHSAVATTLTLDSTTPSSVSRAT